MGELCLSPVDYQEFSVPVYTTRFIDGLKDEAPIVFWVKDAAFALGDMGNPGAAALGVVLGPCFAR